MNLISSLCAGTGTCGKCRIRIENHKENAINSPTLIEKQILGNSINENLRLACQVFPKDDLNLSIIDLNEYRDNLFKIQDSFRNFKLNYPFNPRIIVHSVVISIPTLEDSVDDFKRLLKSLNKFFPDCLSVSKLDLLRKMGNLILNNVIKMNVVVDKEKNELIEVYDEEKPILGVVVDIGTTSIVATLINLKTGLIISADSIINPQIEFGRDIMTRLTYSLYSDQNRKHLHEKVLIGISKLMSDLTRELPLSITDIYEIVIVGNTVMQHLFLNLPINRLSRAPFVPIINDKISINSRELDPDNLLKISVNTRITVAPNIGSFIGSDVTADILYTDFDKKKGIHLLIDFGTNSEIILIKDSNIYAASVAAGGAFEGQHIKCGMRGVIGAIDKFSIINGEYQYHIIQAKEAKGICGSGIIDILAQLRINGQLDKRGRLFDKTGVKINKLILVPEEKTSSNEPMFITRHDVEAIQKAKAATFAAIRTLMGELNIQIKDLESIHIAGVFGFNLNISNAKIIGLLPDLPNEKFIIQGNTAEKGGRVFLLSLEARESASIIAHSIHRLELSTIKDFQAYFTEELFFPEIKS